MTQPFFYGFVVVGEVLLLLTFKASRELHHNCCKRPREVQVSAAGARAERTNYATDTGGSPTYNCYTTASLES